MTEKAARSVPSIWVSGIAGLLAGDRHCEWSVWFRANHPDFARQPSDFDRVTWMVNHTALVRRTATMLESAGYAVATEQQNRFALAGSVGTLAGKPDLIAVRGREGLILDAKTGSPRAADRVQVMLYLWAVPKCLPRYAGVAFEGRVVYPAGDAVVPAADVDLAFVGRVRDTIRAVSDAQAARRVPSFNECRWCPITAADCPDRLDAGGGAVGETDEF